MGTACTKDSKNEGATEEVKITPEKESATETPATGTQSTTEPVPESTEVPAEPEAPPPEPPKLTVMLVRARGLKNKDWIGKSDCYCTLQVGDREEVVKRTKTENNTLEPCWMEEAEVVEYTKGEALLFSVYDEDLTKSEKLGRVKLDSDAFQSGFSGELKLDETGNDTAYLQVRVKMAGQEYPESSKPEFTIKLGKKPKKEAGLQVDLQDGKTLYVVAVKPGPFEIYNKSQEKPTEQLRPGDTIVKVNGTEGDAAKLEETLKREQELEVLVRRNYVSSIMVDKKDAKTFGLQFPAKPIGTCLLVTDVLDGPFKDWNEAHPQQTVQKGDRILAVNGEQGKAPQLLKKFAGASKVQVMVACAPRDDTENAWFGWFS